LLPIFVFGIGEVSFGSFGFGVGEWERKPNGFKNAPNGA